VALAGSLFTILTNVNLSSKNNLQIPWLPVKFFFLSDFGQPNPTCEYGD
jgi:hypothetical protein